MTLGIHNDSYYAPQGALSAVLPIPPQLQQQAEVWVRAEAKRRGIPVTEKQVRDFALDLARKELSKRVGVPIPSKIPTTRKEAEKLIKKEVKKAAKREGKKLAKRAAKEVLTSQQAQALVGNIAKNYPSGMPPVVLPKKLTVGAVHEAAMEAGAQWTENWIKTQTGIPITVPRKLSVNAIEESITGVLPSDAAEAMEMTLTIGAQYAASALVAAATGAAIGSAVPGLGTVVGIGVALGIQALKEEYKEDPVLPRCKVKYPCPPLPKVSPVELLPVLAVAEQNARNVVATQEKHPRCVGGANYCAAVFSTISRRSFDVVKNTAPVLGYYQTLNLIPKYQRAANLPLTRSTQNVRSILSVLTRRRNKLSALVAESSKIEQLSPAKLASLRFKLVTELQSAVRQYEFNQSNDTRQWLATLGRFMQRLIAAEKKTAARRVQERAEGERRFREAMKDPAKQRAHELQILRFQCSEGDQTACAKVRELLKTAPAPPRPAPRKPSPAPVAACNALVAQWRGKLPPAARGCLVPSDLRRVHSLCMRAYGPRKTLTPAQALQSANQVALLACRRKGVRI